MKKKILSLLLCIAMLSVSVPAITETFTLEDGTELFNYTAQHMELLLPDEEIANKKLR